MFSSDVLFVSFLVLLLGASLVAQMVKNLQCGRPGFDPWVGKIPWRRAWHPTPVFLPGESPRTEEPHGLQSMRSQRATKHSTGKVKYTRKMKGCEVWHTGVCAKSLQPCPTLCDPMDCSLAVSSVQGTLQARILKWVTIPSSRGSSQPREQTHVSYVFSIDRRVLYHWATRESNSHNSAGSLLTSSHGISARLTNPFTYFTKVVVFVLFFCVFVC